MEHNKPLWIMLWEAVEGLLRAFGTKTRLDVLRGTSEDPGSGMTLSVDLRTGYDRQSSEDAIRQTIVLFAQSHIGEPYKYGVEHAFNEADPEGWDCSELLENAYNRAGLSYPDGCVNQKPVVQHRPVQEPKAGDPTFLGPNANGIPHTGLYDGQGGVIHALGGVAGHVTVWPIHQWMTHPRYQGFFRHPDLAYPPEDRA